MDYERRVDESVTAADTPYRETYETGTVHTRRKTQLQLLIAPYYRIAKTHGITSEKAKFCLWELYQWVVNNPSPNVFLVDSKSGANWASASTLADNDWFVAHWDSPSLLPTSSSQFDVWFQASDAAALNVPPIGQSGLFVRIGWHASGSAWNGSGGVYGSPFFKTDSRVLPVSDEMSRIDVAGGVGGIRCHTSGDDTFLVFAADSGDTYESYQGFWLGNYDHYSANIEVSLALMCGDMFRLGASGLACEVDLNESLGGILTRDNDVRAVRLPYPYGSTLASYSQPEIHESASITREWPIAVGAIRSSGSYELHGWLRGVTWSYGKTNSTLNGENGARILLTDVDSSEYRCYGAVAIPGDGTFPGPTIGYGCKTGGPF